ncbi:methyltransferase domain-containing protein [Roseixanthobacter liquoris]|uniref:methyltransferase domain-containing protein n=1 Tax=Roseixanthobacter liquoris TaxID=3119921 RepID=UPI003726A1CF
MSLGIIDRLIPACAPRAGWLKHLGWRLRCPVCEARLPSFLPGGIDEPVLAERRVIGGGRRPHAICPICGCPDRIRLLYLFLRNRTDLLADMHRLLHVAPEPHLRACFLRMSDLHYVTADIDRPDVDLIMDLMRMPLADACVDAVICSHVLEHVPDDRRALSELFRVLRPGGWAILQVPIAANGATYEDPSIICAEEQRMAFGQRGHVRLYGADFPDRLGEAGFTVEIFSWRSEPERYGGAQNVFGLIPQENVFVARRSL